MDPSLELAAYKSVELAINKALALDPATQQALANFAGDCLSLNCDEPVTLALYLAIEKDSELGSKVCLHKHYEGPVSARLQGSLNDFFQLLSSKDKGTALINSGLTFSGDSQRVLKLQQTLAELDLDWEAQLAKLVGDVPGHFLGEGLKHLARFGQHSRDSFLRHLEEYLHEEGRLLPCRDELESYYHDVSMLQERSERLEAKIQRLQQRIQQRKS